MIDFEKLGPYLIKGKLGQGGMGAVFRGEHSKTGQQVAIKVIAPQIADQPKFRRRFATEIDTLKKLDHPRIVRLIGYGEEQGHLFYSMELVEGQSLQQYIREIKRVPWREAVGFSIDICAALKHAHDMGVVHRDLKPANLLIDFDGALHLTDFGIAKLWLGDEMTAAGAMLGTADYMAPEQAGEGAITERTDLYALGNVLYACLAGRPPFAGKDLTKVITSLHRDPPPPIDLVVPDLPNELAELIHQLLEKAPTDRPRTALSVGKRLKAILEDADQALLTNVDSGNPTIDMSTSESLNLDGSSIDLGSLVDGSTDQKPTIDLDDSIGASASGNIGIEETIDSVADEIPELKTVTPQTHFRTVDQAERRRAAAPLTASEEEPRTYETVWSVVALVGLLLAMVIGAAWMMRAPSATALYNEISQAKDAGDVNSVSGAIKQFLSLYPSDPRAEEISGLADQNDSDRVYRRLRAQARFRGGLDELEPAEQSLLEAMMLREQNPQRARELMQAWLDVYGHADASDPTVARLAPIVKKEMKPLMRSGVAQDNAHALQLRKWIADSIEKLPPEEHAEFLQGVISLYEEKPWAQREVADAKQRIEMMP